MDETDPQQRSFLDQAAEKHERLILLANHAAIALTSARLVEQLQSLNDSLRRQTDLLTKSEQIHQQLLTVALRGGGLQGIATALSTLVSRPVQLLDTLRCYLAGRQGGTATGQALHVHPNTVTQRLQRIQTLSGVDLTRPGHPSPDSGRTRPAGCPYR